MAVPPLALMAQAFMTYEQLQNSWYMFFFQSPLADFVVGLNDLDFIERLWSEWSPGYDASEDLAHVRQALGDPVHLSAALGYYRAMFAEPSAAPEHAAYIANQARVPDTPVLYLHGAQDGCIAPWVAESSLDHLAVGSEMHVIDHAGHFVHLEQVDEVHHLIGFVVINQTIAFEAREGGVESLSIETTIDELINRSRRTFQGFKCLATQFTKGTSIRSLGLRNRGAAGSRVVAALALPRAT
jgi:pimeloyl-ACP methyl ester carboxylesterase